MQLHELKRSFAKIGIKRVGRGGKRGTYSGRGQKGQRARAGHRIRPAERDLIQRLPKLRGIKNKPLALRSVVLNVSDLEKVFSESKVSKRSFLEKGLIKRISDPVKILGDGELKKAFEIKGINVSKKAKEKLLKVGGSVK